jgi:hypothetical protein
LPLRSLSPWTCHCRPWEVKAIRRLSGGERNISLVAELHRLLKVCAAGQCRESCLLRLQHAITWEKMDIDWNLRPFESRPSRSNS